MKNKTILISVIVCTYNRAQLLKNCLRSLEKQTADKKNYEIVVVNNNSSDNTQGIVRDFAEEQTNIRLVIERKQGLSYARNLGWQKAKGKYVAYIDDDAYADRDWIEEIILFTKKYPTVSIFGGPYKRYFLTLPPRWFPDGYGTLDLGKKVKQIYPPKGWLTGTNMVFKKNIFEKYGGFDTNLGLGEHTVIYGEEIELMLRLYKLGEQIYYVPTIKVNHLVVEYKYNMWWLLKSDFFHSFSSSLFIKRKLNFIKGIISFILALLLLPIYLINMEKGIIKRRLYYGLSNIFLSLGQMAGSIYSLRVKLFNH